MIKKLIADKLNILNDKHIIEYINKKKRYGNSAIKFKYNLNNTFYDVDLVIY